MPDQVATPARGADQPEAEIEEEDARQDDIANQEDLTGSGQCQGAREDEVGDRKDRDRQDEALVGASLELPFTKLAI